MWSAALRFMSELLGFAAKRQEINNAPDVKEAKIAQNEVEANDRIAKAIKEKNEDAIRKELSE